MNQTKSLYLESIRLLGNQINQAYFEARKIKLPRDYFQVKQVVACGMGGSQLGVDLIKHLFENRLSMDITQVRDYQLPKFISRQTLVLLLSYSGTTEEVIAAGLLAKKRKAKVIIIATGGDLASQARKNKIPAYIFKPINNPSGQPRLGTGYLIGSIMAFLKNLKILKTSDDQPREMAKAADRSFAEYQDLSQLQDLSQKLVQKVPVIIASEFLQGNTHIMANQINESAKQMAVYFSLPELNHHLLEGLTYPGKMKNFWHFLFFNSKDYYPRNQKRYSITQKVLTQQNISFNQIMFKGSKLSQSMAMLVFGSLLSYQLSKFNKVDPNKIPWVDYLKSQLKK
jgi:glucose/mannose-6-phosphate isomerase